MSYQEYPNNATYRAGIRRGALDREEVRLGQEWDAPKLRIVFAGSVREDLNELGLVIDQCPMELVTEPEKLKTLADYAAGYQHGLKYPEAILTPHQEVLLSILRSYPTGWEVSPTSTDLEVLEYLTLLGYVKRMDLGASDFITPRFALTDKGYAHTFERNKGK